MVTSRPTSARQSEAAPTTSIAAPIVSEPRNVMIATTTVRERPAIELRGTIGVAAGNARIADADMPMSFHGSPMVSTGSVIDMQAPFMQDQPARVVFVHQRNVMSGDDDSGP